MILRNYRQNMAENLLATISNCDSTYIAANLLNCENFLCKYVAVLIGKWSFVILIIMKCRMK